MAIVYKPLLKAMDKTKLVQRQVTVSGKNGTFTRMQWMSPEDAKKFDAKNGKQSNGDDGGKKPPMSETKKITKLLEGENDNIVALTQKHLPKVKWQESDNPAINIARCRKALSARLKAIQSPEHLEKSLHLSGEELKKEAERQASILMKRVREIEPIISEALSDISKDLDIEMAGFKYRLKTEESLARKLKSDYQEAIADKIQLDYTESIGMPMEAIVEKMGDTCRYTFVMDDENYTDNVMAIMEQLGKKGIKPYDSKFKNFWDGAEYKGINTNWVFEGQKMEIQFHTHDGLDIKENKSHDIYEKARIEEDPVKREEFTQQMRDMWNGLRIPPGVNMLNMSLWKPEEIFPKDKD